VVFSVRSDREDSASFETDEADTLLTHITIGKHRSVEQDVGFGIQQLVDIILKALSPGINDTTTAVMTIDFLGAAGEQLAGRVFPSRLRSDGKQLRLIVAARSFDRFMQLAFDLPRINAKGNHAVLLRLLQALALTASGAGSLPDRKQTMQQQAILLLAWANQTLESEYEKQAVQASFVAHRDAWE
jgi:uncharacterized membrane protein